jgi:hypothetical protein
VIGLLPAINEVQGSARQFVCSSRVFVSIRLGEIARASQNVGKSGPKERTEERCELASQLNCLLGISCLQNA